MGTSFFFQFHSNRNGEFVEMEGLQEIEEPFYCVDIVEGIRLYYNVITEKEEVEVSFLDFSLLSKFI